jgi:DNA polymerase elongation subunit (family B)
LKAALPMLSDLTKRRLEAKYHARENSGDQRDVWEGLQSSFKVLINSFYGYLGYSRGLFNDFEAAERVTLAGQDIIRAVVTELERLGAQPIEVDTDGVYFVPPRGVLEQTDELTFIDQVGSVLPTGIRLAHDGRYAGMLSLRLKTYALLEMNGAVTLKGSALRSRRMEACFRDFLRAAAILFMTDRKEEARAAYFQLAEDIRANQVDARQISQWTMINAETIEKQPRLNRLLQRTASGRVSGERVEVYEREDGELGLVNDYDHDANSAVLLRKLRDTSERFEPLFPTHAAFTAFFPPISPRTNLAAAAETQPATQLAMFSE